MPKRLHEGQKKDCMEPQFDEGGNLDDGSVEKYQKIQNTNDAQTPLPRHLNNTLDTYRYPSNSNSQSSSSSIQHAADLDEQLVPGTSSNVSRGVLAVRRHRAMKQVEKELHAQEFDALRKANESKTKEIAALERELRQVKSQNVIIENTLKQAGERSKEDAAIKASFQEREVERKREVDNLEGFILLAANLNSELLNKIDNLTTEIDVLEIILHDCQSFHT